MHSVRFDEVAAHVHKAITGHPAHGGVRDIQHENVRLMNRHKVAFIADEVQHAGTKGVQALRYLADLTAMGLAGHARPDRRRRRTGRQHRRRDAG